VGSSSQPLGEYTTCAIMEKSMNGKSGHGKLDYDLDDEDVEVIGRTRFYTRDLLQYCQDPTTAAEEPKCCVSSNHADDNLELCVYISSIRGGKEPTPKTRTPINGWAYVQRAKTCEFGYCGNGDHSAANLSSPPPPPPFKMPPRPAMPGRPGTPPCEGDYCDKMKTTNDEMAFTDYDYIPDPIPSPPSPPPYPPPLPEPERKGVCRAVGAADTTDTSEALAFGGACWDDQGEFITGFAVESCVSTEGEKPQPGVRTAASCAVVSNVINGEVTGECQTRTVTPIFKIVPGTLSSLLGHPVSCPEHHALTGFKVVPDDRAWYVRKDNPGMFALSATCCPTKGLEVCTTIRSGCSLREDEPLSSLTSLASGEMQCDYEESRAVMTGWSLTSVGCTGHGEVQLVAKCCSVPRETNNTHVFQVFGEDALDRGGPGIAHSDSPEVADFLRSIHSVDAGPLIDAMSIERGSSYVPRHVSAPVKSAEAFDSIAAPPSVSGEGESPAGYTIDRFCTRGGFEDTSDLALFLYRCDPAEAAGDSAPVAVANAGLGASGDARGGGNVFLKVTAKISVGFTGEWMFRAETRAFTGALVIDRAADQITPTGASEAVVHPFATYSDGMVATTKLVLSPGVYTVTLYGAYAAAGDASAHAASDANGVSTDALLFQQHSHCSAFAWTPLSADALSLCGQVEEEEAQEAEGEYEDDYEEEDANSEELTAANRAGFKGAFFSMKLGGKTQSDNYLITQGTFTFLMFTMELDISIKPGPATEGGGIFMWFKFTWAFGTKVLGDIEGHLDVVPFDFSSVKEKGDLSSMAGISLSMGVTIKPYIFNEAMALADPILKLFVMSALTPLVLAVEIAQKILAAAIWALEQAKKAVKAAQRALDHLSRVVMRELNFYKSKENEKVQMESLYHKSVEIKSSYDCQARFKKIYGTGCMTVDGKTECGYEMLYHEELPAGCDNFVAELRQKSDDWWYECCVWYMRIARAFLLVTISVVEAVVYMALLIPRVLLKIVELLLVVVEAALFLAEYILKMAVCAVTKVVDARNVANANHQISTFRFLKWLWRASTRVVRVYELSIGGKFDANALEINGLLDFEFMVRGVILSLSLPLCLSRFLSFAYSNVACTANVNVGLIT